MSALDLAGAPRPEDRAADLGCGSGRDAIEFLRRGWPLTAIDAEPEALRQLLGRPDLPSGASVHAVVARHENAPLPEDLAIVNSSFSLPLCAPPDFDRVWRRIGRALRPGGRFCGQWYGERDSWNGRAGITFLARSAALERLSGFELELFEEEETEGVTAHGNTKHWHIFHIVARKR